MTFETFFSAASDFIWGAPLLILVIGGGFFFLVYSRFLPFRYMGHAVNVLRGKHDDPEDPGEISHFQALSGALASTIGMGNISGVALAVFAGGPGAIFWMWVSAFIGMATKYFTCTLAVMYRGRDSEGELQGGPMYYIREGLGRKWMPLAIFFSVVGFFGATPIFQSNQMVVVIRDTFLEPNGLVFENPFLTDLALGLLIAALAAAVVLGGVKRIGIVASRLVPAMVVLYTVSVLVILLINFSEIIPSFVFILEDAFSAKAALGGAFGMVVIEGAKRAAFSNEAGIGMAPMMHGAAKTKEPVREGLVAMLGPAIDTLLVCTMTGLCIIITDVWRSGEANGILLTSSAFAKSLPGIGPLVLLICVSVFAITTVFGMAYYGQKCLSFLIGVKYGKYFYYWYIALVVVGAISSLDVVVNIIFVAYGLMSIPTMIGALFLAPKVVEASKAYFYKLEK